MIKLRGENEIGIAIKALAREPFARRVSVNAFRAAQASAIEVQLYPSTAQTLREAIETGITAGVFSENELPEVRRFFAGKFRAGSTKAGVTVTVPKKIRAPRITPQAFVK